MNKDEHRRRVLAWTLLGAFVFTSHAVAQVKTAEQVYASAADSVFVVELRDKDGQASRLGTAFLVAPQKLITNAHVIDGGSAFLRVGPVSIACKVDKIDTTNDLALLTVDAPISAQPLTLDTTDQKPGSPVYAVGTPSGLDKTISDGLLTGTRMAGQRKLIQVSAPISAGSSGSPILNSRGLVIGIAVASLTEAQNVNFAVPSRAAIALLTETTALSRDVSVVISEADELQKVIDAKYPIPPAEDSEYNVLHERVSKLWDEALAAAGSDTNLLRKICISAYDSGAYEAAAGAGSRLIKSPRFDTEVRRATVHSMFTTTYSADNASIKAEIAAQVLSLAGPLVATPSKAAPADLQLVATANVLLKHHREAEKYFRLALERADATGWSDVLSEQLLWNLVETNLSLKDLASARRYFTALRKRFTPDAWDYEVFGAGIVEDSENKKNAAEAAELYVTAARLRLKEMANPSNTTADDSLFQQLAFDDFCEASRLFWLAGDSDQQLSTGKQCLQLADGLNNVDYNIGITHRGLAAALNSRGVYDEALSHARSAIAIDPEDGFAHYELAFALDLLGRDQDAVEPAKAALRLTNGKWPNFHFLLGNIYFDLENWEQAQLAYEKASELDKEGTGAPYNVALCLGHRGYMRDAAKWFREVLRRNPNHPEKAAILKRIAELEK